MAYWGYQTKANFAVWIIVSVCFVTGITWMAYGANATAGCKWCKDNSSDLTALSDEANIRDAFGNQGCEAVGYTWMIMEPLDFFRAVGEGDMLNSYYSYCINSGPLAALVGGAIPAGVAVLLTIFYFPFAKKPASDAGTKVVPV